MRKNDFTFLLVKSYLWIKGTLVLVVWVNDILAINDTKEDFNALITLLTIEYAVKNLDFPSNFTGIRILLKKDGSLSLS